MFNDESVVTVQAIRLVGWSYHPEGSLSVNSLCVTAEDFDNTSVYRQATIIKKCLANAKVHHLNQKIAKRSVTYDRKVSKLSLIQFRK